MTRNPVRDKSFDFASDVVKLYKLLTEKRREFILSKQLLRSGTSIGANIREAYNGFSKKDFIHKLSISQKECDESRYWLELLHENDYVTKDEYGLLYNEATQILKLIKSIITATKRNMNQ